MTKTRISLSVPFTLPILGEAFIGTGNPLLSAALDLPLNISVQIEDSAVPDIPIRSPKIRKVLERYLISHGIGGKYTISTPMIDPSDYDYVSASALLFLSSTEEAQIDAPSLLNKVDGKSFITLSRALTSLSGGFVVSRKGEGLISLEGAIDAHVHLKRLPRRSGIQRKVTLFSESFPELADPLWHLLGHLVLDGCEAVRNGDTEKLGRLMELENRLAHSMGLLTLGDLRRIAKHVSSFGGKVICSESFVGELILAPNNSLSSCHERYSFTSDGVSEIGTS
ncbi:MAG: hypothetical protein LUP94_03225 [Candidatus Methanomethylicus sp.]|nr:hypothetical protein [Candidatus Methanomethylicus sp.]